MSQTPPIVAQKGSYKVQVEAGNSYWWCACGQSSTQPFCDGKHKGSGFRPLEYKPATSAIVSFCGCKGTGKAPLCDGSHKGMV